MCLNSSLGDVMFLRSIHVVEVVAEPVREWALRQVVVVAWEDPAGLGPAHVVGRPVSSPVLPFRRVEHAALEIVVEDEQVARGQPALGNRRAGREGKGGL
jgi:hypothetical protein